LLPPCKLSYDIGRGVNILRNRYSLTKLVLTLPLCVCVSAVFGAWQDKTAGRPLVLNFPNKEMGDNNSKWTTLEDKLGRLFVAGAQLHVFDGEHWQSYPVPDAISVRSIAFGEDGRIWTAAMNQVGYFAEESLGMFMYHSLVGALPEAERQLGEVWDCATVGRYVFFFCRNKVMRWDGSAFQTWFYPGKSRLFPMKLDGEPWFHDMQTGLYRVTPDGPELKVPAALLPQAGILGLGRDPNGLVVACDLGLFRPGTPPVRLSDDAVGSFLHGTQLASFGVMSGGGYILGTTNAGLALVAEDGRLIRAFGTKDGLPSQSVYSIRPDSSGFIWCATADGVFRLELAGHATLYDPLNGLDGTKVSDIVPYADCLHVATYAGVFRMVSSEGRGSRFERVPQLSPIYLNMQPYQGGLLLGRHGGMDYYDGQNVTQLVSTPANTVYLIQPSRTNPNCLYFLDALHLNELEAKPDGTFICTELTECSQGSSLYQDSGNKLWLGTYGQGAYHYDPPPAQLSTITDPATKVAFPGQTWVAGNDQRILIFHRDRILEAKPPRTDLWVIDGLPPLELLAPPTLIPGSTGYLVSFKHSPGSENPVQSLGVLKFNPAGNAQLQQLDVPALGSAGSTRVLRFTEENGHPLLWVGGSDGLLRLDFDALKTVQRPVPPLIQFDHRNSSPTSSKDQLIFPFQDHRISLRLFTGSYSKSRDWLLQTRLGNGQEDWSAQSARRSFQFSNLSEGEYRFEARTINAAGLTSEPAVFTFRILPPWYRSAGAYAGYVGLFIGAVFVLIRVRERQIRVRNQELEQTVALRTEELVKASAAKDEFLAAISHEIRNPMNGVIGIAETFRTDALDAEGRHKFGLLRQCATHLSSLLEDILDFSRVQAGMVELEPKPFDVAEITGAIAAITATESQKRGIPVEIAVSPAVPARLIGDARRIRQILLNFVANALKFSGRGQVSVTVWCKSAGPDKTEVIFAVSDEGPGISPEEQKRLFTRFERGAAAQRGRVAGTGLGLALCKGLAEKMGGRIWLESEPGEGSCFYFSAPFAVPEAAAEPEPSATLAAIGRGRTALVVDDEEYNRIALTDLLEALGFTAHSAADGLSALARAGKWDFDLVFLDFDLPGMSGLDTSRGLRALPNASARALIVATTAFTTQDKRNQCIAAGMDTFLSKPVTLERLRKVLDTAPVPAAAAAPEPADPLANLRLITRRKGSSFQEELALYLSEFEVELDNLRVALQHEDSPNAGHYAHLLYGRSAFIAETQLELTLRKIEEQAAGGRWPEARTLLQDVQGQLDGLRIRLTSAGSAAQPGSGR